MNTIVGMQASLHASVSDDLSDLLKTEIDPHAEAACQGSATELDICIDDDFDADDLLKGPLFNNSTDQFDKSFSNEASFGTFGDCNDNASGRASSVGSENIEEFYDSSPASHSVQEFEVEAAPGTTSMSFQNAPSPISLPQTNSIGNGIQSSYNTIPSSATFVREPPKASKSEGAFRSPLQNEATMSPMAMSNMYPDARQSPQRNASYSDNHFARQQVSPPAQMAASMHTRMPYARSPLAQGQKQARPIGLSSSMHGGMFSTVTPQAMLSPNLNTSFHGGEPMRQARFVDDSMQRHSMHGHGVQSFGGITNSSIASEAVSPKLHSNGYDAQGNQQQPSNLGEVMEKLCESMKRSAMSRNLVKQLSGSGRTLLTRQNSGLMMSKQLSNRSLMRQGSNRTLMDDGSGRGTPSAVPMRRLSNTKHHLQHPGRGVYRHDSQQSLNGHSNHGINLHIDGRNMGTY